MKKKKKDCIFEPKRKKGDKRSFKRFQDSLRWNNILKDLLRNFKISKDFQKLAQDIESTWPRLFVKLLVTLLATFKRKNDDLKEKCFFYERKKKIREKNNFKRTKDFLRETNIFKGGAASECVQSYCGGQATFKKKKR